MPEDPKERVDRELIELLNELRVALPGVQVLFAFLLTVPFTQRFEKLSSETIDVYFAAVVLTALATVLLVVPSAHHRVRFRMGSKEQLLKVGNASALVGLFLLALAVGASVYVVGDLVYESGRAQLFAALLAVTTVVVWFLVPLLYRSDGPDGRPDGES